MGSPAPLAEFDEALAVQGFYTRVQRERSDKALDAFDQELREPPGYPNWTHSEFLKPEGVHPTRLLLTKQSRRWILPPTPQTTQSQKTTREVLDEIVEIRNSTWSEAFTEKEFKIAIKDALRQGNLDADKENVDAVLQRVEENLDPLLDTHYKRGDVWADDPEVNWIWDGWIAEGYVHTCSTMQKVGKSTFLLNLIAELIQRTASFLNFPLFSEKKYGFCW